MLAFRRYACVQHIGQTINTFHDVADIGDSLNLQFSIGQLQDFGHDRLYDLSSGKP